jgi:DNA-directed RNA polymerase specialized sigma24 family protein
MCAARAGDDASFARLWRDTNPLLVRYLRVVGHDDPYDGACEVWVSVVRALPDFDGDEADWHVLLLRRARMRAQDGMLRRAWGSVTGGAHPDGAGVEAQQMAEGAGWVDPIDLDDLDELGPDEQWRGALSDTLNALRDLPLGQGEVLLLRLSAGLSVRDTSRVTDIDELAVRRLEDRALERLEVDRELLAWSMAAPVTVGELADERVALGRYRALGLDSGGTGRASTRRHPARARSTRPTGRPAPGVALARRSRTAVLTLAAVSASAVSLGGLSAAAYVGVLPAPVQEVMHRAVGAPAPSSSPDGSKPNPNGPGGTRPAKPGTTPGQTSRPTGSQPAHPGAEPLTSSGPAPATPPTTPGSPPAATTGTPATSVTAPPPDADPTTSDPTTSDSTASPSPEASATSTTGRQRPGKGHSPTSTKTATSTATSTATRGVKGTKTRPPGTGKQTTTKPAKPASAQRPSATAGSADATDATDATDAAVIPDAGAGSAAR